MDPTTELASSFTGEQIAKVLRNSGPTVKCVLLRCSPSSSDDAKPSAEVQDADADADEKPDLENGNGTTTKKVLTDLIEEIEVDTTPKKQMVAQVIGGPFTFLGQYEDEGIVVIIRRPEDVEASVGEGVEVATNPHELQPPLHNAEVKGDILLLRVAATEEEEVEEVGIEKTNGINDAKEGDSSATAGCEETQAATIAGKFMSNEEFFLNYTLEEYVKFASRTDIVPQEEPEELEGDGEVSEDEDSEEDEECNAESDSDEMEDDEECQIGMMNLILAQILKRFREENGRGPNTMELLAMRSALAEKLGIDESAINQNEAKDDETNDDGKRKADDSEDVSQREKRVKFTNEDEVKIMTDDEGAATTTL
jgi:hypothetical protein